jgi:predicted DNA-binding transcriptional regulator AlpA
MTEQFITLTQISKEMKMTRMGAHRLLTAGEFPNAKKLPGDKKINLWLIPMSDYEAFLHRRKLQRAESPAKENPE